MNLCASHREELAAFAATREPLGAAVEAHLERCPYCRGILKDLEAVATLNLRVATQLPEPFHPVRLATKFLQSTDSKNSTLVYPFARRALIACAVAACVIALFVMRDSRQDLHGPIVASAEDHKTEPPWQPTWQRLREEERMDTLGADHVGSYAVVHYRVRDAYSDLN